MMIKHDESNLTKISFLKDFGIGSSAAITAKTIVAPLENLREHVARTKSSLRSLSPEILKKNGLKKSISHHFKGVFRYFLPQALNIAIFEATRRNITPSYQLEEQPAKFVAGNIISGAVAGVASLALMYPFDLVDMQKQRTKGALTSWQIMKTLGKLHGFRGLFTGMSFNLPVVALYRSIFFGGYFSTRDQVTSGDPTRDIIAKYGVAQAFSALATTISHPLQVVRNQMIQTHKLKSTNSEMWLGCAQEMWANHGAKAFFRGMGGSLVMTMASSVFLVLYDEIQNRLRNGPQSV